MDRTAGQGAVLGTGMSTGREEATHVADVRSGAATQPPRGEAHLVVAELAAALPLDVMLAALPPSVCLPAGWVLERLAADAARGAGASRTSVLQRLAAQLASATPSPASRVMGAPDGSTPVAPITGEPELGVPGDASLDAPTTSDVATVDASGIRWLTAREYGARRVPRRSADWVRDACLRQRIPGAVRMGKEWMIPEAALMSELTTATRMTRRSSEVPTRATSAGTEAPRRTVRHASPEHEGLEGGAAPRQVASRARPAPPSSRPPLAPTPAAQPRSRRPSGGGAPDGATRRWRSPSAAPAPAVE